ncbi:MAG: hypothetical protein IPL25_03495 [Saprospiraceae bacterium]|nr:hypothetical protein [Candidatus Vicinibacter affinis]
MKKKLFVIAFLLFLGSKNYMDRNFALENLGFSEENFSKMFQDSSGLAAFYSDTLRYKCEVLNCTNSETYTVQKFKESMLRYYRADYVFAFSYTAMFILISLSLSYHRRWNKSTLYFFVGSAILLLIADLSENTMMIEFINSNYAKYNHLIPWINGLKTVLFVVLCLCLFFFRIPFLVGRFNAWVRSEG